MISPQRTCLHMKDAKSPLYMHMGDYTSIKQSAKISANTDQTEEPELSFV